MALLTEGKINQFGVQEEYWRILSINLNVQYGYCDITIGAYANSQTREKGAEPMNIKKVRAKWDEEEFFKFFSPVSFNEGTSTLNDDNLSNNIYARAYEYVKQKDKHFENAKDC